VSSLSVSQRAKGENGDAPFWAIGNESQFLFKLKLWLSRRIGVSGTCHSSYRCFKGQYITLWVSNGGNGRSLRTCDLCN
jgi:hypothetical protein